MRAALLAILMLGCGGALHDQPDLPETVRMFNEGVRWERFTAAAAALPPRDRSQFVDDMDQRSGEVKITDYEIVRVDPRGEREARVQIKLTWYNPSQNTVHETHAVQTWERHGKDWWMVDEVRLRGAEMPGLAESQETAASPVPVMKD